MSTPIVLTIAGSDSGGGAGIQADLLTFAAHGVHGLTAITAVTAQSTTEVRGVHPIPAAFVRLQLETLADDFDIAAVKTGMLGSAEVVRVVGRFLEGIDVPVVVDPVMIATSGARLLDDDAVGAVAEILMPRATVVTPNLPEAEALVGPGRSMEEAARDLVARGAGAALVKGGHLPGDDVVDVLFDGEAVHRFEGPRIRTTSTHGTGCTYAAAIAAQLAAAVPLHEAVRRSYSYLREALETAPRGIGRGAGPVGHPVRR